MKISIFILAFLFSLSIYAQVSAKTCDEIFIGNTGLSYNIKELSKAIRANNDQQIKVVEVDVYVHKVFKDSDKVQSPSNESASQLFNSVVLIASSKKELAPDKYKHLVGGAVISYGSKEMARYYFKGDENAELKSTLTGVIVSSLTGVLKEMRDSQGYGNVEVKDALATSAGGALVSVRYNFIF